MLPLDLVGPPVGGCAPAVAGHVAAARRRPQQGGPCGIVDFDRGD